jgi:lipopolysaccharide/colanic/teichoic acid biosynthesis glycosyltransferase
MRWGVRATKRTIDIVAAAMGLVLPAPLFPLVALAIYLDSPGPLFITQRRAGRLLGANSDQIRFEEFQLRKFRTMCVDAEKYTGAVLATENDPRITRVGRILRRTRLDELPQLWSVLNGTMSLVGPRPERPELLVDLARAIPWFEERMRSVKPGLTGYAQVSLSYTGKPLLESEALEHSEELTNPFRLPRADGALADDMRWKLLYDMAYVGALEDFRTFLVMETAVLIKTPLVMLRGLGR